MFSDASTHCRDESEKTDRGSQGVQNAKLPARQFRHHGDFTEGRFHAGHSETNEANHRRLECGSCLFKVSRVP